MPDSIAYDSPASDHGTMTSAEGQYRGTLPPTSPDFLPIYERLIAAGVQLTPYTLPAPVAPPDISDRQFAAGLWEDDIISYTDFLGFIGPGTIPAAIQAIVDTLADDDTGQPTPRKMAIGFLTGSKTYEFAHPLVEEFRQAMAAADKKWTPDYLRQQWLIWATL